MSRNIGPASTPSHTCTQARAKIAMYSLCCCLFAPAGAPSTMTNTASAAAAETAAHAVHALVAAAPCHARPLLASAHDLPPPPAPPLRPRAPRTGPAHAHAAKAGAAMMQQQLAGTHRHWAMESRWAAMVLRVGMWRQGTASAVAAALHRLPSLLLGLTLAHLPGQRHQQQTRTGAKAGTALPQQVASADGQAVRRGGPTGQQHLAGTGAEAGALSSGSAGSAGNRL